VKLCYLDMVTLPVRSGDLDIVTSTFYI
jgi:hypothetical protein